jgi:hypothetical protein
MLEFFTAYTGFYKQHRSVFRDNDLGTQAVRVGTGGVSAGLLVQRGTGARTIHLVNHHYDRGSTPARPLRHSRAGLIGILRTGLIGGPAPTGA